MHDHRHPSDLIDTAGKNGAVLAMIEIGLGSLLHAFHVPFGGFFLSLNQGFVLSRAVKTHRHEPYAKVLPLHVSNVTALLKSLSPAGNRLGPMIAIAMQGLLFNNGVAVLGANFWGCLVGMTLLCLWSYLQIALYFYFLFGKKLVDVLSFHLQEIQTVFALDLKHAALGVSLLILAKIVLGAVLVVLAFALSESRFQKYQSRLLKAYHLRPGLGTSPSLRATLATSLKDLLSPTFIATFVLMAAFFVLSGTSWQETIFYLIRPLAVGFALFFLIRILPTQRIAFYLEGTRFRGLSRSLRRAVGLIRTNPCHSEQSEESNLAK